MIRIQKSAIGYHKTVGIGVIMVRSAANIWVSIQIFYRNAFWFCYRRNTKEKAVGSGTCSKATLYIQREMELRVHTFIWRAIQKIWRRCQSQSSGFPGELACTTQKIIGNVLYDQETLTFWQKKEPHFFWPPFWTVSSAHVSNALTEQQWYKPIISLQSMLRFSTTVSQRTEGAKRRKILNPFLKDAFPTFSYNCHNWQLNSDTRFY